MKEPLPEITVMRFDMIGAKHWYVTSSCGNIYKKFNTYKAAERYAKTVTTEDKITAHK